MNKLSLRLPALAIIVLLSSTLQLACAQPADAPGADPNLSHPNQVVTVAVQGHTIPGLVTHLRDARAFKHGREVPGDVKR